MNQEQKGNDEKISALQQLAESLRKEIAKQKRLIKRLEKKGN